MSVRVVIVDDEPSAREIIRYNLSNAGCEIVGEAGDTREAAEVILAQVPDLVTLDIFMPEPHEANVDARTLFREIRRQFPEIEFAIISGASYDQNRRDFLGSGVVGFFEKPIDFRRLLESLRHIFTELKPYRTSAR